MKYYSGVGSRSTPSEVLTKMRSLAKELSASGYVLRSGGAEGADTAFEEGCACKEIYTPWQGFNGRKNVALCRPSMPAYQQAAKVHPAWDQLSGGARALHARNVHQVFGADLDKPSAFVVCWTPDGCTGRTTRTRNTGGTATAIVLAENAGIPVFNLRNEGAEAALRSFALFDNADLF